MHCCSFCSSIQFITTIVLSMYFYYHTIHVWSIIQYIAHSRLGCFLNEFHCLFSFTLRITVLSFLHCASSTMLFSTCNAMQCNAILIGLRVDRFLSIFHNLFARIYFTVPTSTFILISGGLVRRTMMGLPLQHHLCQSIHLFPSTNDCVLTSDPLPAGGLLDQEQVGSKGGWREERTALPLSAMNVNKRKQSIVRVGSSTPFDFFMGKDTRISLVFSSQKIVASGYIPMTDWNWTDYKLLSIEENAVGKLISKL